MAKNLRNYKLFKGFTTLLLLALVGCKGTPSAEDQVSEAERAVESEEQAREVEAIFEGTFEHSIDLHGDITTTKLVLTPTELRQWKNDLLVFSATCERTVLTLRRVSLDCTQESGRVTHWPLEMTADGHLFHRAQPELVFTRVNNQVE